MTMHRIFLVWLCAFSSATLCIAQAARDVSSNEDAFFVGTWVLDAAKSDLGSAKSDYDGLTIVILQWRPELTIVRKVVKGKKEHSQNLLYYTDGRGESNVSIAGKGVIKSKTKWVGDVLLSKGLYHAVFAGEVIEFDTTDKWELSADRKTLVNTTVSTPPRSAFGTPTIVLSYDQTTTRVFRRVP